MTYDKETLDAIDESITHWQENAELTTLPAMKQILGDNCALCKMFEYCDGCPIKDKEYRDHIDEYGKWEGCNGSPWGSVMSAYQRWSRNETTGALFRKRAARMRDYLITLGGG